MGKQCKNLTELKSELLKHVKNGMLTTVSEVVKEEEVKQIREVVYDVYEPSIYKRRQDNGGLADKDNMDAQVVPSGSINDVEMLITNKTKGNPDYADGKNSDTYIAPIIETGHDGGYGVYDFGTGKEEFSRPRRFQKATVEALQQNKEHVKALEEYLKQVGFKTK